MNAQKTILLVEDDPEVRQPLKAALEEKGYRVIESDRAEVGFQLFVTRRPDLVVLDLDLPDGYGLDITLRIRKSKGKSKTPIIILTAHSDVDTKMAGLDFGADQFLVKPVAPEEFIRWVGALLRRVEFESGEGAQLTVGELTLRIESREAFHGKTAVPALTAKEFELLHYLVKNRTRVVSRKEILSKVWKTVAVDHTVDTHIGNLRKKLPVEIADKIQNVRGRGFRYFD